MPADVLTQEQFDTTGYGQFKSTPTRPALERFFFLDDALELLDFLMIHNLARRH